MIFPHSLVAFYPIPHPVLPSHPLPAAPNFLSHTRPAICYLIKRPTKKASLIRQAVQRIAFTSTRMYRTGPAWDGGLETFECNFAELSGSLIIKFRTTYVTSPRWNFQEPNPILIPFDPPPISVSFRSSDLKICNILRIVLRGEFLRIFSRYI